MIFLKKKKYLEGYATNVNGSDLQVVGVQVIIVYLFYLYFILKISYFGYDHNLVQERMME